MRLDVRDSVDGEKPFTFARRLVHFLRCTQGYEEMQLQTVCFFGRYLSRIFSNPIITDQCDFLAAIV